MKKNLFKLGTIIILIVVALSGCQEQGVTTNNKNFEGIFLESNLVEIADASLDFKVHYEYNDQEEEIEIIDNVDVKYLFHNIASRDITISVTAEFYDKDNNLIAKRPQLNEPLKTIFLFNDYTERAHTPVNTISFDGRRVAEVDHVKIIVEEI